MYIQPYIYIHIYAAQEGRAAQLRRMRLAGQPPTPTSRLYHVPQTYSISERGKLSLGALGFRKVDVRLPETVNSISHGARPVHLNHHDNKVDSDKSVGNKELSLCTGVGRILDCRALWESWDRRLVRKCAAVPSRARI